MNKIYQHNNNNNNNNNNNSHRSNAPPGSNSAGANNTMTRVGPQANSAVTPANATQTTNVPTNNNHTGGGGGHHQQQQQHHHNHHHHPRHNAHSQHQSHHHQLHHHHQAHHNQQNHHQHHHHHHQQQQSQQQHHQHQHQQQPQAHMHPPPQQVPPQLSSQQPQGSQPHPNPHHHPNPSYMQHTTGHIPPDSIDHQLSQQSQQQHHHPQQPQPQQIPPQTMQAPALGAPPPSQAGQQQHPSQSQQQNNQHNPMVKHPQAPQQSPIVSTQLHQQQPHHHHNHHHNVHHPNQQQQQHHPIHQQQQPPNQMPISQSMPQQWVGPHPPMPVPTSQAQHHHHHPQQSAQQHHPHQPQQQPQQQQQPPPNPHHMAHPPSAQMMMNPSYPGGNIFYTPVGGHPFIPANHLQPPPPPPPAQFEHSPSASHQADPVNMNSQQQPVSISNHHPGNLPLNQIPPAVISSASTGTTNVHQINNGHMMDPHMASRVPLNQQPHMMNPYMQGPFMLPYPPHLNPNLYSYGPPGGHHLPNNPTMIPPIRVPTDIGVRQQFDTQNSAAPVPPTAPITQQQPSGPKPQITTVPLPPANLINSTPIPSIPPIKPRPKKALAIVDPLTKHVYTEDELKGSPSTPQSQSSKDSGAPKSSPKDSLSSDKDSAINDDIIKRSPVELLSTENSSSNEEVTPTVEVILDSDPPKSGEIKTTIVTPVQAKLPIQSPPPGVQLESQSQVSHSPLVQQQTPQPQAPIPTPQQRKGALEEKVLPNGESGHEQSEERALSNLTKEVAAISISVNDENQSDESVGCEGTPVKKRTLLNLPYEKNQYSPLNQSGNKKYSINFCRALYDEMKPDLDKSTPKMAAMDFAPYYVTSNSGGMNYGRDHSMSQPMARRASQQGVKPRKIITTHSLQQEVELKTAEKPWKPELETEKSKVAEGEMDTKRLLKVFRGHLNKLTPQKYDSLIEKIGELDLSGADRLNEVINLVFDKAVDEPNFCELYARMCKVIAAKNSDFCFHLVKKCQDEFETSDLYEGLNVDHRQVEIDLETDSNKKKLMSEELYEDMRLRRAKYLGTIKLIGEMYKLGLLIPVIIGFCMSRLMEDASNENIECLCSLIETVGAKLAREPDRGIKDALSTTIKSLAGLADPRKVNELFVLESRIKFRIQDTVDLSKRNWRPRMVENNPKKIEEIREEAKEEKLRQQFHNHSSQVNKNLSKPDDRDRNRRSDMYPYPPRASKW